MGDMADLYDMDFDDEDGGEVDDLPVAVWTTKVGMEIPICYMTDMHLFNALNYLQVKHPDSGWIAYLEEEQQRRKTYGINVLGEESTGSSLTDPSSSKARSGWP
ncbi:MAG: hypothetical protein DRI65_06105 [Chloroflexota bacterium]|nr:MAG: hypothetical protein DRI65_06105 [Chloroflexota bacterium]